ncbi:hydroxymethylpyrimidine/phosphomethylpyrimidine kinase [Oikeobacillus pervagus]|uniref:Hydroxymethylpyrimidine/phosphomethylpyrimidine kinase n=1 Tax=Oikeobacillus pervagus TaxID=1325931 RepID=A0AAJ1T1T8_9BACI|nr:bifunctional hydroxymethylpyrimidine kinase/phosphomethylpyrimidine kinase [Oikeobacillus pervagus]MDQ0214389.1 hydroxymethylpyrimidine/phosphomethylpyrimidine kinase [Oikeobacillus pervagus]
MKTALTIAGSDSGGGAGIQADLKTFSAHGVFGMSVITAVTAQNTKEVRGVQNIDVDIIRQQIEAIYDDLPVNAVKIGMLSSVEIIDTVSSSLKERKSQPIVLDPVMISKSGHSLLLPNAVKALIEKLVPLADIITPNVPEAEELTGIKIQTEEDMVTACKKICELGAANVLLKGGHLEGEPHDLFFNGENIHWFKGKRVHTKNTHGTGCTLSSAIAANLAKENDLYTAVKKAKQYISMAITHSLDIGKGHGPTHHFYELYQKAGYQQ